MLVNLSATMKKVSYLDETQIKVRKATNKFKDGPPQAKCAFKRTLFRNVPGMVQFSRKCAEFPNAWAKIVGSDARKLNLGDESVDLIVTSPPYINAIDYTMSHKYNLFLLDLVMPESFKKFCRNFIGVTERVAYRRDYEKLNQVGNAHIDEIISRIYNLNLKPDVDKNRAFVVYQYFAGIKKALEEMFRVLKPGAICIIILGDNTIRKVYIPTHLLVQELAEEKEIGFRTITRFYHRIQARRLGINRNHTGGKIKDELVMVLQKPI
jgi:tRNA G10  N-methylase Trm11